MTVVRTYTSGSLCWGSAPTALPSRLTLVRAPSQVKTPTYPFRRARSDEPFDEPGRRRPALVEPRDRLRRILGELLPLSASVAKLVAEPRSVPESRSGLPCAPMMWP